MSDVSLSKNSARSPVPSPGAVIRLLNMLWRDKLAFVSAVVLLLIVLAALIGPALLGEMANDQNLRGRNFPPFSLARGWELGPGGDSLGRAVLVRLSVAVHSTLLFASGTGALA